MQGKQIPRLEDLAFKLARYSVGQMCCAETLSIQKVHAKPAIEEIECYSYSQASTENRAMECDCRLYITVSVATSLRTRKIAVQSFTAIDPNPIR